MHSSDSATAAASAAAADSGGGPAAIAIAVTVAAIAVVVLAIAALVAVLRARGLLGGRSARLRKRFGPEYERAVEAHDGDAAAAEEDLAERLSRRAGRELREPGARERSGYARDWAQVQWEFVDDPVGAVRSAQALVGRVLDDLGYPPAGRGAGFDRRVDDLSVDHPAAAAAFRRSAPAGGPSAGTEDLRASLVAHRTLVEALIGPVPRGRAAAAGPGPQEAGPAADAAPGQSSAGGGSGNTGAAR
ncbi:hypothetical protein [Nocardiopsis coralliicola]